MTFDIGRHLLFFVKTGSYGYGLETESSDYDYAGVYVGDQQHYLGFVTEDFIDNNAVINTSLINTFSLNNDKKVEISLYEIRKFIKLCLQNNPNIFDILFADDTAIIFCDPVFKKLLDYKNHFLSKQIKHRYSGYALSQLKRIKSHKKWLDHPVETKPQRSEFGLPDSFSALSSAELDSLSAFAKFKTDSLLPNADSLSEAEKIDMKEKIYELLVHVCDSLKIQHDLSSFQDLIAISNEGFGKKLIPKELQNIYDREKQYKAALQNYNHYQQWKSSRNPDRAKLEMMYGIDTKHAMHLIRLMKIGSEILKTGQVNIKRSSDREELLDIKRGKWSFEEIIDWAKRENERMDKLLKISPLPDKPNEALIEGIMIDIIKRKLALTTEI